LKIFISRKLSDTSNFQSLVKKGFDIVDESLIHFEPKAFSLTKDYDWIFFYSPHSVQFFFEKESIDKSVKYGVMGSGSAHAFRNVTGRDADFIGNGNSKYAADYFLAQHQEATILFPQTNRSLSQIENLLGDKIKHDRVIIYTSKKKSLSLPDFDVLIFTSPLNAEAYFDIVGYHSESVFAIGETTAKKIYDIVQAKAYYCSSPSEKNLFDLVVQTLDLSV